MASIFRFTQTCAFVSIFYHCLQTLVLWYRVWMLLLQALDSLRLVGINPFLDNRIGRTRRLLEPGNVVVSLCRNRYQLFFTPKFAQEAGLLPFPCGLLWYLVVRKQVDAFKYSLKWSPRDPNLSELPLSLFARIVFDTQILLCS